MNQKIFIWVILGLLLFNFVGAEMLISEAGVEYDSESIDAFNNLTFAEENMWHNATNYQTLDIIGDEVWLRVMIRLKDNSGIEIVGTREERRKLINEKEEWFEPVIDDVLGTLSEEDMKIAGKSSDGFDGLISRQGLEKLIRDEKVKEINWPRRGATAVNNSPLIKNWYWIVLIIMLYFIIEKLRNNKKQTRKRKK
ncbi:hypothetical protein HQ529_04675 [Candidatus Woesearchaeota archaeon]|nr:hypothetical protein [Candidatus Woesearchaeota archaeon]